MAGGPGWFGGDQQRVGVAVERDGDQPQDVAAGLALAPEPPTRPRMEVHFAGGHRRLERLGVHPRDHQDASVGGILDHRGHEAVGAKTDVRSRHDVPGGHATARTGSPAAAIAALTSAMEWTGRWKIDGARTASAPPSRTAATKSAGPAAPPLAMTGTWTRKLIARSSSVSYPLRVPSRSMDVTSSSPAPRSTTRVAHSTASSP